jgi:hypothetical protein
LEFLDIKKAVMIYSTYGRVNYCETQGIAVKMAKLLARGHHAHKTKQAGVSFYIYPLFIIPLRAIKTEQ